jgi:hypothetical protein
MLPGSETNETGQNGLASSTSFVPSRGKASILVHVYRSKIFVGSCFLWYIFWYMHQMSILLL